MSVRDDGWVRPKPLGSIVLGLGVRVTIQWYIYGDEKFGVTVISLPCGSQADGRARR